jgi:hypothetical protein
VLKRAPKAAQSQLARSPSGKKEPPCRPEGDVCFGFRVARVRVSYFSPGVEFDVADRRALRRAMDAQGVTTKELARRLGRPQATLYSYFCAARRPPAHFPDLAARALGFHCWQQLVGEDAQQQESLS